MIVDWFIPGLHHSFGVLWPLTLGLLIGGIVLAIARGRTPVVRALGVVAALSAIAYLFTPLTAAGRLNQPDAFEVNLRYLSALGLGAMLLAIDPVLSRERWQKLLIGALAVLLVVSVAPIDAFEDVWRWKYLAGGVLLAAILVGVPVGLTLASRRGVSRVTIAAAAALAIGIAIGVGWTREEDYADGRYRADTAPSDFPEGMQEALAWFNREEPTDARIAVVGGKPGFKQYIFYGDDLSNRVQYVAAHGPHGAYRPIGDCEQWYAALNDGDYDYLVAGPDQRTQSKPPVEAQWTRSDPGAEEVLRTDDLISVFRLGDDLDPSSCNAPPQPEAAIESGTGKGYAGNATTT